ncbi:hypothetical protein [Sphingomonas desiccabilis]|uniref:hypothetical protein n=1 Tax=Sphingomonas desiccabilis TaxID=429134 RepID=UPI0013EDE419|nr:hypothetical protein [Sphingomonas desiccabilis]MBB3912551.1 hypothetical protein [Sphingomonas desiccabilis]
MPPFQQLTELSRGGVINSTSLLLIHRPNNRAHAEGDQRLDKILRTVAPHPVAPDRFARLPSLNCPPGVPFQVPDDSVARESTGQKVLEDLALDECLLYPGAAARLRPPASRPS